MGIVLWHSFFSFHRQPGAGGTTGTAVRPRKQGIYVHPSPPAPPWYTYTYIVPLLDFFRNCKRVDHEHCVAWRSVESSLAS